MSSNFVPVDRAQRYLFPPSIQDWLPENHLARFVVDIVSQLDLRPLVETYAGKGGQARRITRKFFYHFWVPQQNLWVAFGVGRYPRA